MANILSTVSGEKEPWLAGFIVKVGLPMAAFVGITIWALWRVDANIITIKDDVSSHINDTSHVIKQNEEIKNLLQRQINLSIQICVNTSRNNNRGCFNQ